MGGSRIRKFFFPRSWAPIKPSENYGTAISVQSPSLLIGQLENLEDIEGLGTVLHKQDRTISHQGHASQYRDARAVEEAFLHTARAVSTRKLLLVPSVNTT